MNRTQKSIKNTVFGLLGTIATMLLSFISRSIFIKYLGTEFNGLNSLFTNILSVLNLAELGFAGAVAYALYKPLSKNDTQSVAMIMNYLKIIYRIIAIVVAIVGLLCIPFLQYLINEPISELPFNINQLRLYFSLYLLNTIISYLLAYKRTIISADQNQYMISNIDNISNVILNILQIALLIFAKNYYIFLGSMLVKTILTNIVLSIYADKKYPYIIKTKEIISKDIRKPILKNVSAMFLHRIGSVVIFGTISIIISSFIGIKEAGMYGNYILIIAGVSSFINVIFTSFLASIGNLCATSDIELQINIYRKVDYISNWCSYFTFICYVCLFNHFITIWIGQENIFSIYVVIAVAFSPMISYLRKGICNFKDAKGLFWNDRFKPLIEAGLGISLAIGLSYVWGIFGIIIGYTLASLIIALPIEIYVLFKHGFQKPIIPQLLKKLIVILFTFIICVLVYWLCSLISLSGILGFVLKLLMCLIVPNIIFIICTFWTDEFKYFKSLAITLLKKMFKRKSKKEQ